MLFRIACNANTKVSSGTILQIFIQIASFIQIINLSNQVNWECISFRLRCEIAFTSRLITSKGYHILYAQKIQIYQYILRILSSETAAYGHMGRINETVKKSFKSADGKTKIDLDVELFTWEKLDFVEAFKGAFNC